jgi:hypothetical protein
MIKSIEILNSRKNYLTGRVYMEEEILLLLKSFKDLSFIKEFLNIFSNYRIIGQVFTLSKDQDFSRMGMDMEWMDAKTQIVEAFEAYPGILLIDHGYLPIGSCLMGSGDPYFLKPDNNNKWNIYRGLHDMASGLVYKDELIEFVNSLDDLLINIPL